VAVVRTAKLVEVVGPIFVERMNAIQKHAFNSKSNAVGFPMAVPGRSTVVGVFIRKPVEVRVRSTNVGVRRKLVLNSEPIAEPCLMGVMVR
jgi:hypothetical protein